VPHTNRLATETSPYLLQHSTNPVDWWPWGEEAFAEARRRDVPVLISIGYSACHWCHVMAHESFEDPEVARALNEGFVSVKVDREERPDVDALYMEAVQLVSGSGGWPMTVFATPLGHPFFAGTYFPRSQFLRLVKQVSNLWQSRRDQLEGDAHALSEALKAQAATLCKLPEDCESWADALARAAAAVLQRADPDWGGALGAPKFPQPPALEALARQWWRSGDDLSLSALRKALDAMSSGGIYDHLGGGFHRYSTDRYWLVPHFEKMLYDNALLIGAYTHAWQLTGSARYRQVVEETAQYLLAGPLRLSEGLWASSEDADSEGHEGRYYVWPYRELVDVAGEEAALWFGALPEGNWEGDNILWRPGIGELQRPPEVEEARRRLFEHRQRRPRPGLDAKVLTEWNAMAVSALVTAGTALGRSEWVVAAQDTAEALCAHLRRPNGRWLRTWLPTSGEAPKLAAYAGDYAWLVDAFTRLGEATGKARWTEEAQVTARQLEALFWDHAAAGFFTTGSDAEQLLARLKDVEDGAVPSANSTACVALGRLGELSGEPRWLQLATAILDLLSPLSAKAPAALCWLALGADYLASPRREVVVTSCSPEFVRPLHERYLPDTVLTWCEPFASALWEARTGPEAAEQAFVCERYVCQLPLSSPEQLAGALGAPAARPAEWTPSGAAPGATSASKFAQVPTDCPGRTGTIEVDADQP